MFSTEHFYVMQDEDSNTPLNVVSMPNLSEEDLIVPANEMNERLCIVLQRLYDQILSTDKKVNLKTGFYKNWIIKSVQLFLLNIFSWFSTNAWRTTTIFVAT